MHLRAPFVLVSFVALLLPSVVANRLFRGDSKTSAESVHARNDVIAARQFRARRDTSDNCVSLSGIEFAKRVNLVYDPAFEELSVVTCKRDIETWLANDPNGKALIKSIGLDAAKKSLHILFSGSPTIQNPPDLARRWQLLPSGLAAVLGLQFRRSLPIMTLVQAKQTCKINESVCGVPGSEDDARAFECIDTRSSLDNCGGCIIPHPFYEPYRMTSKGVECGRLPQVLSAQCMQSNCVVYQCKDGYEPSQDKTKCVPVTSESLIQHVLVDDASPASQSISREVEDSTD